MDEDKLQVENSSEDNEKSVLEQLEVNAKQKPIDLKQLAIDLYENKIFTDLHLASEDNIGMLPMVFMPIALGAFSNETEESLNERVGMIYEYYDKAGPKSINGYPSFLSFRMINPKERDKMFEYYDQYKKVIEAFDKMD